MSIRSMTDFPRNEQGLVDNFIGSAYDVVKGVYEALPELNQIYEQIELIPTIAEDSVETAMVPARAEIAGMVQGIDVLVDQAAASAALAADNADRANAINVRYPFALTGQPFYDVTVISGDPQANTASMALWVEGAIDFSFIINSSTLFSLTDPEALVGVQQLSIILNARFNDVVRNLEELEQSFEDQFSEFLENSSYEHPYVYMAGIPLTRSTQTVTYNGNLYAVHHSYLPLTTSNWGVDGPKMVIVGDTALRQELATKGAEMNGFTRKPYTLNQAVHDVADYFQVHDIHLQEFADFVVDGDWSYAFEQAFASGAPFSAQAGVGGRIRIGGGRFGLRRQVNIPFGWYIEGSSTDFYGTALYPLPDFVGTWMCKFTSPITSYNNGHWNLVNMDMGGYPALGCLLFEGAYRSSSIKNSTFRNVARDAAGLIVRPMSHPGAMSVCESVNISDVYVIKDRTDNLPQTVDGIQLYSLQESTLLNVKCFHSGNPAPVLGGYPIYVEDCRGINILGGGVVGGDAGIRLHAKTRNCTGVNIIGMTWENNASNIKTSGEGGFLCAIIDVPAMRVEFPAPALSLDLQGCSGAKFVVGSGSVTVAADCNNVVIETNGIGTRTVAVGAQVTFIDRGNAINKSYRVSPFLDVYGDASPQVSLSVNGRTGSWNFNWNASAGSDLGARIRSPLGNTALTFTDTGSGPTSRVENRMYIHADNTPVQHWEVTGKSGTWHWEWAASSSTDFGMRMVSPGGRTTFSAIDDGVKASIGFFDGIRAPRQIITGSMASSDPVLKLLVQALAAYGLITNSTTG